MQIILLRPLFFSLLIWHVDDEFQIEKYYYSADRMRRWTLGEKCDEMLTT